MLRVLGLLHDKGSFQQPVIKANQCLDFPLGVCDELWDVESVVWISCTPIEVVVVVVIASARVDHEDMLVKVALVFVLMMLHVGEGTGVMVNALL